MLVVQVRRDAARFGLAARVCEAMAAISSTITATCAASVGVRPSKRRVSGDENGGLKQWVEFCNVER